MGKRFKVGDKVFAKVKGYPHWPAVVVEDKYKGKKYGVLFYGTRETGNIKAEDICYYTMNKEMFMKYSKKPHYVDAIKEIEEAIEKDGGDGNDNDDADSTSYSVNTSLDGSTTSSRNAEKKGTKRKAGANDDNISISSSATLSARGSIRGASEISVKEAEIEPPTVTNKRSRRSTAAAKENVEANNDAKKNVNANKSKPRARPSRAAKDKTEDLEAYAQEGEEVYNPDVVTESLFKNNILYADHVRKEESLYKSRTVEERKDTQNQLFPVQLPSGIMCGLKLHKNWPLDFENEFERAIYDETIAKKLLDYKERLTSGEITQPEDKELFIERLNMTADDVKEIAYKSDIDSQKKRIDRLGNEAELVALDAKIKNALGLDNADPESALNYLKEIYEIEIDELMMKKHVHVLDMVRRLQKYIGNVKDWKMGDEEIVRFEKKAEKIRKEAEKLYAKIKETVKVPDNGGTYWDSFLQLVSKFRDECKDLSPGQISVLCAEPKSRQAFFDQLVKLSSDKVVCNGVSNSEVVTRNENDDSTTVQGWTEKS